MSGGLALARRPTRCADALRGRRAFPRSSVAQSSERPLPAGRDASGFAGEMDVEPLLGEASAQTDLNRSG